MSLAARVAVIPGDGIGPEVITVASAALEAAARMEGGSVELTSYDFGAERYLKTGVGLPPGMLEELAGYDAILLGALGDPRVPDMAHAEEILLGLRRGLDLYVNLRPVRLLAPALSPIKGLDELELTVVRENTEGLYCGIGGTLRPGTPEEVAVQQSIDTRHGVERIIRYAFEYARKRKRRSVTLVDKSNVLRHGHGLWRRVFHQVAREFPELEPRCLYADAAACLLVQEPRSFEVVVADNLLGDLLSDLTAGLVGGLGLAPSANLHPGRTGLFEPVHGSAPDLAGQDRANPIGAVMSAALLLAELDLPGAARRLESAVERLVRSGQTTPDLGGPLGTRAFGAELLREL